MLKLINISKRFGSFTAVHPLNLDCITGETTVLIGPSGCGKSTLLKLMIRLLVPETGRVQFNETTLNGTNIQTIRHHMGYVIQEGGLFPHLSVSDNISLAANYLKWSSEKINRRIAELLELNQLPKQLLNRFPMQLSGGQRQRVSLMRALMLDPEVLLLDEPLGALDPMIRAGLQKDLKAIFDRLHKTVVLVTHDMGEAAFLGHEIVLLKEGQVVQTGNIGELIHNPASEFVQSFLQAQRWVPEFTGIDG